MGAINRHIIGRLQRRLALAADRNTYVEIDRKIAHRQLMEERGDAVTVSWLWLAVPVLVGAFFLPAAWMAAGLAGLAGIVIGRNMKG